MCRAAERGVDKIMIEVNHLKKSYGRKKILKDVSLRAESGRCIGIIGANGCGKSTLLSILAGIQKPDEGEILYFGEKAGRDSRFFLKYTGYVPQEHPLIPELTVRDNLSLWFADSGKNLEEELESGLLYDLGIREFLKKKVKHLSGGMKKKVSIACAVARKVPILILDEPGAALDLPSKRDIQNYMRQYAEAGGTVILSSHEEGEIGICDELYALTGGFLVPAERDLSREELIQRYFAG